MKIKEMIRKHMIKQNFILPLVTHTNRYYISTTAPVKYYRSRWTMNNKKLEIENEEINEAEYTEAYWMYTDLFKGGKCDIELIEGDSMDVEQYNSLLLKAAAFIKNDKRLIEGKENV